jgi:hypothetical protein
MDKKTAGSRGMNANTNNSGQGQLIGVQPQNGELFDRVAFILDRAQASVVRSVNNQMVIAYWLFTSGKGRGFNALVYMHRYDRTLLAKIGTDHLLELEAKLDARIAMLSESARDKQEKERIGKLVLELAAYDEKLNNKAPIKKNNNNQYKYFEKSTIEAESL